MPRKDIFGTEVEVGDIVFSSPRNGVPDVGIVHSVSETGRVMYRHPIYRTIRAYEIPGAPLIPGEEWAYLKDEQGNYVVEKDRWGYERKKYGKVPAMVKNWEEVGKEWRWVVDQAADITLVVLRKNGEEFKTLDEMMGFSRLAEIVKLDYSRPRPELPKPEGE